MFHFHDVKNRCSGFIRLFQKNKHEILYKLFVLVIQNFKLLAWLHQTSQLIVYDKINPTQYIFHEDTETCTPVYTVYDQDYKKFYQNASKDIEMAKKTHGYGLDMLNHPNWFDASYMSWISYDSLNVELPDGYLFFMPIINWGRYREENGRLVMPVTVRLNHASADGYLLAQVYRILEKEIKEFCK